MKWSLEQLIPQKRKMCLLDKLTQHGKDFAECEVQIRPNSLFSTKEGVPSWVGLEYMAQTVAAYAGIQKLSEGLPPEIGLLIGIRNYRVLEHHFNFGETFVIRATEEYRDQNVGVYSCSIKFQSGLQMASASLKGYMGIPAS